MKTFENKICAMNTHYRYYSLEYFLDSCVENNLQHIELWTCPHHFFLGNERYVEPEKIKRMLEERDLKTVSFCPEQNNPKLHNIASDDKTIQKKTFKYFSNAIRTAKYLNCPTVLITSGWARYDEKKDKAWDRSVRMLRKISKVANSYGINLALEALQPNESLLINNIEDLRRMRNEVGNESLKICIDFGAMARAKETVAEYFEAFGDDIVHVHFVDGNPTGHLAWGDGSRNLSKDLENLTRYGYEGYLSLEYANDKYFQNPKEADSRSVEIIRRKING